MRKSYDFSNAAQGVHHKAYNEGHSVRIIVDDEPHSDGGQELNLVSLDPDVKAAFPDSKAVNEALRLLIKAAKSAQELQKAS